MRAGPAVKSSICAVRSAARPGLLLVGSVDAAPKISDYGGQGPLDSWTAVVAQRQFARLLRKDASEQHAREGAATEAALDARRVSGGGAREAALPRRIRARDGGCAGDAGRAGPAAAAPPAAQPDQRREDRQDVRRRPGDGFALAGETHAIASRPRSRACCANVWALRPTRSRRWPAPSPARSISVFRACSAPPSSASNSPLTFRGCCAGSSPPGADPGS